MKLRRIGGAVAAATLLSAGLLAGSLAGSVTAALAANEVDPSEADPSEASMTFSPSTAGTRAAMTDHIVLRSPEGPDAPPSALDELRIEAPAGTRFDTSAVPVCEASDIQLQLLGPAACPDSRIGDGTLDAVTGVHLTDPLPTKLALLNGEAGPISLVQEKLTGLVLSIDRFTIEDNALVAHPPKLPGATPELRTATRQIRHNWSSEFVTTPESCDGSWEFTVTIGFADDSTQTAGGSTGCTR